MIWSLDQPLSELMELSPNLGEGSVCIIILDPVQFLQLSSQVSVHDLHLLLQPLKARAKLKEMLNDILWKC